MITDRSTVAKKRLRIFIIITLILFPTLTNLVKHTGSACLAVFTLTGLPILLFSKHRPLLEPHEKWVMWAFFLYSATYTLSFVVNGVTGTMQDLRLSHLDHELRFLAVVPIFMLIRSLRISQSILWVGILAGATISGGYALLSFFWIFPGERVYGAYHAIAFGDLSLALAFMSIPAVDWLKNRSTAIRLIPMMAFILAMVAVLLSKTRGAWIAIPALAIVIFFYSASLYRIATRVICLSTAILILFVAYQVPAFNISGRINDAFKEVTAYIDGDRAYTSIAGRIEGWRVAFDIFDDNPVFGAGPGNYEPLMHRMIEQGKHYEIAAVHSQPHGAYPSSMADCGIVGILALLGVFALPLVSAIRFIRHDTQVRHLGYVLLILVFSFMHFGLTETIFSLNVNVTFYIIFTAAIMAVAANEKDDAPENQKNTSTNSAWRNPGLPGLGGDSNSTL